MIALDKLEPDERTDERTLAFLELLVGAKKTLYYKYFRPYSYYSEEQDEDVSVLVIDSIVDIIFFIDIIFNFHTSFVSNSGEVITNEKKIRRYVQMDYGHHLLESF